MTEREDLTRELVALAALEELLTRRKAELKERARTLFPRVGTREVAAVDDTVVGAVNLTKGSTGYQVRDSEAFLRWVQAEHPDEIVPAVRESFTAALIKDLLRTGGIDPTTGEQQLPPGMVEVIREPYLRVTKTPEATAAVLRALGDAGQIIGLREIES